MPAPVLATKLFIPPHRSKVVVRPRLIERLNKGLGRQLTLLSEPAGFGKTTLLAEWVAGCGRPPGEGDGDPARFLAYLIAALQTTYSKAGKEVLGSLQSPQHMLLTPVAFVKKARFAPMGSRSAGNMKKELIALAELVEAGRLKAVIDRTYPLERIAEAHRYVETGRNRGSVVILIKPGDPK